MRYRIEYADGKCCSFANSSRDLIDWLKLLKDETISDIRKIYKSGATDSVKEKYQKYINIYRCCSTVKIFRCNQNQRNVFYKNLWKGVR